MPCHKLGIKFGRADILKRFLASGRTGFYFSVQREGEVGAGDEVELIGRDANGVTVADEDARLVQPLGGEVLAEHARREFHAR